MRVAVVGAGVSGLAATKCCLDEGLEPTCFEQSQDIGGLWRYTEHIEAGRPSVYPSLISNTSKEMSAFSDFPFPEHFPVFLPNALLLDYLRRYAERFSLRERIRLGTTVVSIRKRPDFATTGQWNVVTEAGGKQTSDVFDAVMVCIGNFSEPSLPLHSFPGIERFRGQYFHSRQYKHPDVFQGKRVLVVGMGNSGVDIAVEASRVAAKVTISTSRGSWLLSRVFEHGYPWDMVSITRLKTLIKTSLPRGLSWRLINSKVNKRFNHTNYGLQPDNSWHVREALLNDDLPSYILTGRITIKLGVKEFKDSSVLFHNCPEEEPVDIVVFCTGYVVSFPFLEESIIKVENKHASLYKHVFPTHLQKPTLAVLGLIKPLGPVMPLVEMQARWVSRVFKGLCHLPSQSVMEKEVNENKKNQVKWFGLTYDEVLKTEWQVYLDMLASFIGAKPSVLELLCTDPKLALTIFFGPCSPYQYRLGGPGRWEGARQAILTQWDRVIKPTRTRVPAGSSSSFPSLLVVVGFLLLLAAVIFAALTPACHLLQASMVRRVAVIGAGAGGLVSVKCCLEEGLEPTCFESSEDIGGIWRYTDSTDSRRVSVYRSVISNTSKEMSCFSDFPFPQDFPSYLPHGLVLEYFRMYARHFDLLRHVRFQTTVLSVRKCPDFATSGQWEVVTEAGGVRESHVFDAVMVCTGHYQEPYLPLASFPGIESRFKGQCLHSREYRDGQDFRGKRVLVVGIGNTGGDLSVELSHVAAKVFLSTRSHTWVLSRVADHGFPRDMVGTTRFNHLLEWLLPSALARRIKFQKLNSWFNHTNYGLASSRSSKFKMIINEELPFCLLSGTVVLKPNVKEFTESSAVFEDGTTEENIDVVLFATGYNFSFPFLEESVGRAIDDNRSLYKCVFPPQLEKPTLAIIGLIQLTGSIMVGMMAEVLKSKPPVKSVTRLLLTDPQLALAIFFGPCSPYQYRLVGRGSWSGARAAILSQWQRTLKPLRTRVLADSSDCPSSWCWMCLLALPAALTAGFLFSKYSWAGPQL
ncbi:hypothetical protein Nmel_011151 [Mimus melanotis]